jgi:hypothetical protein
MARYPTLTCPTCRQPAPVREFPEGRDDVSHFRRCPNCGRIVERDARPVNGARTGFQRIHTLPIPADLRNARNLPDDIQATIPIIGYVDATTPDCVIHSPILEKRARTATILSKLPPPVDTNNEDAPCST